MPWTRCRFALTSSGRGLRTCMLGTKAKGAGARGLSLVTCPKLGVPPFSALQMFAVNASVKGKTGLRHRSKLQQDPVSLDLDQENLEDLFRRAFVMGRVSDQGAFEHRQASSCGSCHWPNVGVWCAGLKQNECACFRQKKVQLNFA